MLLAITYDQGSTFTKLKNKFGKSSFPENTSFDGIKKEKNVSLKKRNRNCKT